MQMRMMQSGAFYLCDHAKANITKCDVRENEGIGVLVKSATVALEDCEVGPSMHVDVHCLWRVYAHAMTQIRCPPREAFIMHSNSDVDEQRSAIREVRVHHTQRHGST